MITDKLLTLCSNMKIFMPTSYDLFVDAGAVGFHLGTTAAGHFENLLQIAIPGEFLFCGEIPEEMKQSAIGMGLNATFAPHIFGFNRN